MSLGAPPTASQVNPKRTRTQMPSESLVAFVTDGQMPARQTDLPARSADQPKSSYHGRANNSVKRARHPRLRALCQKPGTTGGRGASQPRENLLDEELESCIIKLDGRPCCNSLFWMSIELGGLEPPTSTPRGPAKEGGGRAAIAPQLQHFSVTKRVGYLPEPGHCFKGQTLYIEMASPPPHQWSWVRQVPPPPPLWLWWFRVGLELV